MIDAFELLMQDKVNSEEGFREYIPVSKLQGSILWDEMVEQQKKSLISDIISYYWCPLKIFGDFRDFYFLGQPIYWTHK